jgi:adenosine kinase
MQIYVSGSLAFDRIMTFPGKFSDHILPEKIHILNVCFLVNGLDEKFGGTAGNIAYSLALLQEKPLVLSTAGRDFGPYREWMERHGLSLDGVTVHDDLPTAGAYITTDKSDNQITGFNPGAMNHASNYRFTRIRAGETIACVSPGNLEDMQEYPRVYRKLSIPYIMDPGQNIPAFSGEQLVEMCTNAAVLISNDYELEMIMQSTGLDRDGLLDKAKAVVTTLGEHGCVVHERGGASAEVPAVPVSSVEDPTGAGDAFRAGLIKGLAMGRDLPSAARVGATCAAYAVERKGTQEHAFTPEEFWRRHDAAFPA